MRPRKAKVAVGPPIDILCYKTDSPQVKMRTHLEQDDPYLQEISRKWQDGIVRLVRQMPAADFSKTALGFAPNGRQRRRVGLPIVEPAVPRTAALV